MAKRLEIAEALSTRAMKRLSKEQGLIQEQEQLIKAKEKESKVIFEAVDP